MERYLLSQQPDTIVANKLPDTGHASSWCTKRKKRTRSHEGKKIEEKKRKSAPTQICLEEEKVPRVETADVVLTGDCLKIIPSIDVQVDGVITSPPYNLGKNPNHRRKDQSDHDFYSSYDDAKSAKEYTKLIVQLFRELEKVVAPKGIVLLNMSYSSKDASLPYHVVVSVEKKTSWKNRETLFWKKPTAMPFQTSPRNLSRIVEQVFLFARNTDFVTNKAVKSVNEKTGQKFYAYADNYIEAPCFDPGTRKHHKATFPCALVEHLLRLYFPEGSIILDPFCGTGTTAVACKRTGRHYIMIDIDPSYTKFSEERVAE